MITTSQVADYIASKYVGFDAGYLKWLLDHPHTAPNTLKQMIIVMCYDMLNSEENL